MPLNNSTSMSLLDKVRLNKGTNELRSFFSTLLKNNKQEAINLINDNHLSFTSLFILKAVIEESNLLSNLNWRNQISLQIINEVLKKRVPTEEQLSPDYKQKLHSVLKWMLKTGFTDDGLNDEYDEVLDITSAILITEFKDNSVLPIIVHMIFERNKKGTLTHDLIWALFQSEAPQSLILIADRLLSPNPKDVELSRKLLSFVSEIDMNSNGDNKNQYVTFINWINENIPFLTFTGESFQQCSAPAPYTVRLDAKYLCRCKLINNNTRSNSVTKEELTLLEIFNNLDENTKILLAKFSFMLYRQNPYFWHMWIKSSIAEQIKVARIRIGGVT